MKVLILVTLFHITFAASLDYVDWNKMARSELMAALELRPITGVAKNVILFMGDGMGISTITAARILKGQRKGQPGEEENLIFDKFPYLGLIKAYNVDSQVGDSAACATAMLTGVKTNFYTAGVNQLVRQGECHNVSGNELDNIFNWSHDEGKSVGMVTTTRVTHATPATTYAHTADRFWEVDGDIPEGCRPESKDVAAQFISEGKHFNVMMGGGRKNFLPTTESDPEYYNSPGHRTDGRNLIQEWIDDKEMRQVNYSFAWNSSQFEMVDGEKTDYFLGLFAHDHMNYECERHNDLAGEPSLVDMTQKAIEILRTNLKGYFLMVEGGRIDHGHHAGRANKALDETLVFERAIERALEMTNPEETLILVTADHSHTMTIGGYPKRGHSISGVNFPPGVEPPLDGMPFTTLMYANGPGAGRRNILGEDTAAMDYKQEALIPMQLETHGGEDVSVHALGPWSHLFHGVHEQNYLAHVMAYASCVGTDKSLCENGEGTDQKTHLVDFTSAASVKHISLMSLSIFIFYIAFI